MNVFDNNYPNKMPLFLDDLRFMDGIFRDIITQALINTGATHFGCDSTFEVGGYHEVFPGVVVINNELFYFSGGRIDGDEQDRIGFVIQETKAGNRNFGDGTPRQVYIIRTAVLQNFDVDGYPEHYTLLDFNDRFTKKYEPRIFSKKTAFNKDFGTVFDSVARGNHNHDSSYASISHVHEGAWVYPTLNAGWFTNPSNPIRYRRIGKNLQITGYVTQDTGGFATPFTLQDGYKPNSIVPFFAPTFYASPNEIATIFLHPDGFFSFVNGRDRAYINEIIPIE
jgi:hypothetical protein